MSDFLYNHPLFINLSDDFRQELFGFFEKKVAPKGTVLFAAGDTPQFIYIIAKGWVKLFRTSEEGHHAIVAMCQQHDLCGDERFLAEGLYHSHAEAISETILYKMPYEKFIYYRTYHLDFVNNLVNLLTKTQQFYMHEVEHRTLQNAPQRLGCFLLRLCYPQDKGTARISLPYDKYHIAHQLGMQAETFSRALKKLCNSLDIRIANHEVFIQDVAELADYVCGACSSQYPCGDL